MLLYKPAEIPPLWFDEGWSLTVARNWVETGQYARFLQGNPITAYGLAKPFSVTGPIALSFSLFGVGIWQGRLTAMISMALALYLIFQLARQLYDPIVAYLTLFVLLFLATPYNPWIMGRQAIGEAPMVFYLIGGYVFLLASLNGKKYALLGAMIFWGLALDSKGHVLPFWSVSMLLPIAVTFLRKQWSQFKLFGLAWVGSFPVYFLMLGIQKVLYSHYPLYDGAVQGFFTLGVFVITPEVRLLTLENILIYGIPTLIGFYYAIKHSWHEFRVPGPDQTAFYVRLSLLGLVISWFAWFALLSLGWGRYFFPISFLGSIFIALWLREFLRNGKQLITGELKRFPLSRVKIYGLLLVLVYAVSLNIFILHNQFVEGNDNASQVAEYVKQSIGSDALIETFESELMFLLDNPIHYPPDQVHIDLNRRIFLGQDVNVVYDPTPINFRYLIVGPMSTNWQLYASTLQQEHFQLIYEVGDYQIYKRIP
jgi:hypothetical protein